MRHGRSGGCGWREEHPLKVHMCVLWCDIEVQRFILGGRTLWVMTCGGTYVCRTFDSQLHVAMRDNTNSPVELPGERELASVTNSHSRY